MKFIQRKLDRNEGFTLFELLLAMAIIGAIAIPFLITFRNSRANQALRTSAEQVADHTRSSHVFAREAAGKKGWGVKSESDTTYAIISGTKTDWEVDSRYSLNTQISFIDDFFVWFEIGSGETDNSHSIRLINMNGIQSEVSINQNGVVEVMNE